MTAVGDNINIAARLEAQTKTLGCDVIVSLETLQGENINSDGLALEDVPVRGRSEGLRVCTLDQSQLGELKLD